GLGTGVVEGAHHLDAAEHAEGFVEGAAGGDGVDVGAHQHARQAAVAARAGGVDVADAVDPHLEPGLAHPLYAAAAGLGVGVGQRQAPDPAQPGHLVVVGADLLQLHQGVPEPAAVDPDGAGHRVCPSVLSRPTTASPLRPGAHRRPGPGSAARTPGKPAAPVGPEETPSRPRSPAARSASSSLTATAASHPARSTGQAEAETVPQFRPAITVAAVGTVTGRPAVRLASTQAAVSGSAKSTRGGATPGRR